MIKNILFVDEMVPDYDVFLRSVNASTKAIPYSSFTTYEQLRQAVPGPIDQCGFVFIKGGLFLGKPFTEQIDFFVFLVQEFEVKHIDFLACNTLNNPEWKTFYEKFPSTVIVGASDNQTGNLQYGGDWIMESTSEDVEGIYFTDSIEYYKYLLDSSNGTIFFVDSNDILYGMGRNDNYQLGIHSNVKLREFAAVQLNGSDFTGVQKIRTDDGVFGVFSTVVQVGNKLYGFGGNDQGIFGVGTSGNNGSPSAQLVPLELTMPIAGMITDFDVGAQNIFVIIGGALYVKGAYFGGTTNASRPYTRVLINAPDDALATQVYCSGSTIAVVLNNKVFIRFFDTQSSLVQAPFPAGITGTITKVVCCKGNAMAIIDGNLYGYGISSGGIFTNASRTTQFVQGFFTAGLGGGAIGFVTDIAIGDGRWWFVSDNKLYGFGANEWGEMGAAGPNKIIPTTGTILGISSKISSTLVVNIDNVLYGIGLNNNSQIGGPPDTTNVFRVIPFRVPATNATVFSLSPGYTMAVVGGTLYGVGNNNNSQLGIVKRDKISTPLAIQLNPGESNSVNITGVTIPRVSTCNTHTWIGIGEDVYCSGINITGNRAALGSGVTQSTKFIKLTLPVGSSGAVTLVSVGEVYSFFVKGNKVYGCFNTNQNANMSIAQLNLPAGVTGTIKLLANSGGHAVVVVDDGTTKTPYGIGRNFEGQLGFSSESQLTPGTYSTYLGSINPINTFSPLKYNNVTMTNVTGVSCNNQRTTVIMNNEVYFAGIDTQTSINTFTKVSLPAGTVEFIDNGYNYSAAVVSGTLYGFATEYGQVGLGENIPSLSARFSSPAKSGGANITGVTNLKCLEGTTFVTQGKLFKGVGWNQYGQLGTAPNPTSTLTLIFSDIIGEKMIIGTASPRFGANGSTYTITGDLLTKIVSVQFGTNTITSLTKTATLVTFTVPTGSGLITPVVTDNDGKTYTLNTFDYSNPMKLQTITYTDLKGVITTGISGKGNQNEFVKILGVDLSSVDSIRFGTVSTTSFTLLSSTECSVIVPPRDTAQGVNVAISFLDSHGTVSENTLSFEYTIMTITEIRDASTNVVITETVCGKKINIIGTNFVSASKIYFNTLAYSWTVRLGSTGLQVIVPNVIGDVTIRVTDGNANIVTYASKLKCTADVKTLASTTAIITYSASPPIGNHYYAMSDKTIILFNSITNTFSTIYTHSNEIKGLAYYTRFRTGVTSNLLFFGDSDNRRIYTLDLSTKVATLFHFRNTMIPTAIKILGTQMVVLCSNINSSTTTNDSIIKFDLITDTIIFSIDYSAFSTYQLRRCTFNTEQLTDTSIYVSVVPFEGTNEINITQGRVIKLSSTGAIQNSTFITGVNNPKDLMFVKGYLLVDGNIQFYDPSGGAPISSFETDATTITVVGDNVYFSSTTGATSILNQITVETRVPDVLSVGALTPTSGPEGTLVFISGNKMTTSNILGVTVNGSAYPYLVSDLLLTLRMPEPLGAITSTIVVTYQDVSEIKTRSNVFTYANSNIINVIPLYAQETKYFHFTGTSLKNILYVDFGDTQKTTLTTRTPVYNSSETSFDCSFIDLPVNSTRILLQDAYGNTTYEDAAMFTLSSETCFVGGTPVLTDQGMVAIDKINPKIHTLDKKEILAVTKIRYNGNALVLLEQDSLRKKYPTRDTVISRKHKIYYKGKMKTAESFVGHKGVQLVPYQNQYLYNILLKTHEKMSVNGLICETLHPKNPIVKYFI